MLNSNTLNLLIILIKAEFKRIHFPIIDFLYISINFLRNLNQKKIKKNRFFFKFH